MKKQKLSSLRIIHRWDEGRLPRWKNVELILDYFSEIKKLYYAHSFLAIYFMKNAIKVFEDLNLLSNEDKYFEYIIIDLISMLREKRKPEEFYDVTFGKEDNIEYHLLINDCLSSVRQPNGDTKRLFDKLEQKCPNSKKFFSPWLRAKMVLCSNSRNTDYKEIRNYYRNAFDKGKYYAGCFMWQFILEAIALENCHGSEGNWNDYYAFGYALEMFTGDKETLRETLNSIKHFELFEQYEWIKEFCDYLWSGLLLNKPYKVPNTELLLKGYLKME